MIKIAQFGEGNFLRSFADVYFSQLNKVADEKYSIDVITPIPSPVLDKFRQSNNEYNVVFRGVKNGSASESYERIDIINKVICPFSEPDSFFSLARERELKIIISNTTEAGIVFDCTDRFDRFPSVSYPAKLTRFLYERFLSGGEGVYILPVELIDDNARHLSECVDKYIELWQLGDEFYKWNKKSNFYLCTLVDRIVSGFPRDEVQRGALYSLIGEEDPLLSVCEPFGLWVIERGAEIENYVKCGLHNVEVIIADDIAYYKKRKVRVLNGLHTSIVAQGILLGKRYVFDVMTDARMLGFLEGCAEEIIPFVGEDESKTREFYLAVKERFENPYLAHELTSILLNSVSKWRARVLPSFKDYYKRYGVVPENLTRGLAALIALYSRAESTEEGYFAQTPIGRIRLLDEEKYLSFFADGKGVREFLSCADAFGEDMNGYEGLTETVERIVREFT